MFDCFDFLIFLVEERIVENVVNGKFGIFFDGVVVKVFIVFVVV